MDYEVQRCTRHCVETEREILPGETCYSVLIASGSELERQDYCAEAWDGPPEDAVGWWKSQIPDAKSKKKHWAPNDVMLQFFDELGEQEDRQDMRYVLSLLLVRRRVMRVEDEERDTEGREVLVVYCPRRETTYKIPAVMPGNEARIEEIQAELAQLLE